MKEGHNKCRHKQKMSNSEVDNENSVDIEM